MMHRDIVSAERSAAMREQFSPFEPWFFLGVAVVEIYMMIAFGFAVIQSIIHRKQSENHAWWLILTVFKISMPALGRGVQNVHVGIQIKNWPIVEIMSSLYIAEGLILTLLFLGVWEYRKSKHPATWLAVSVNLFNLFLEPLGRSEIVQLFLKTIIIGLILLYPIHRVL